MVVLDTVVRPVAYIVRLVNAGENLVNGNQTLKAISRLQIYETGTPSFSRVNHKTGTRHDYRLLSSRHCTV